MCITCIFKELFSFLRSCRGTVFLVLVSAPDSWRCRGSLRLCQLILDHCQRIFCSPCRRRCPLLPFWLFFLLQARWVIVHSRLRRVALRRTHSRSISGLRDLDCILCGAFLLLLMWWNKMSLTALCRLVDS